MVLRSEAWSRRFGIPKLFRTSWRALLLACHGFGTATRLLGKSLSLAEVALYGCIISLHVTYLRLTIHISMIFHPFTFWQYLGLLSMFPRLVLQSTWIKRMVASLVPLVLTLSTLLSALPRPFVWLSSRHIWARRCPLTPQYWSASVSSSASYTI